MDRLVLSDAAWERMAPLIIGRPDQKGSTGRDNRMFVEGVLWIVRTGSPWRRRSSAGVWRLEQRVSGASADGASSRGAGGGSSRGCRIIRTLLFCSSIPATCGRISTPQGADHRRSALKRRSRGDLKAKIHMAVRGLGYPGTVHADHQVEERSRRKRPR